MAGLIVSVLDKWFRVFINMSLIRKVSSDIEIRKKSVHRLLFKSNDRPCQLLLLNYCLFLTEFELHLLKTYITGKIATF